MLLFRALAKNMAPMTKADESPTNRLTLFPIYLSLFIVSTLCLMQVVSIRYDTIRYDTSFFTDLIYLTGKNGKIHNMHQACGASGRVVGGTSVYEPRYHIHHDQRNRQEKGS